MRLSTDGNDTSTISDILIVDIWSLSRKTVRRADEHTESKYFILFLFLVFIIIGLWLHSLFVIYRKRLSLPTPPPKKNNKFENTPLSKYDYLNI